MGNVFYAVQFVINDRKGTLPSIFAFKSDAIDYATRLKNLKDDDVKTEVHLYEVKEIEY